MKRCIICGNTGDENSTVCNVCGGPFEDTVEMTNTQNMELISKQLEEILQSAEEEESVVELTLEDLEEKDELAEAKASVMELSETKEQEAVQPSQEKVQSTEPRPARRMKSEPQIYGQAQMGNMQAYNEQQGMVRRNMQGRPVQAQPANGAPQGRPMQAQPMNGAPQGRPVQAQPMNGAPQGRPVQVQPMNGAPQGRPMQAQPVEGASQAMPVDRYAKAVRDTARKCMKSPLFFLVVLLNTVSLAGSIAAIFLKDLNYAQYARLIADFGLPAQVAGYMDEIKSIMVTLDTSAVGINLALLIPNMLFCLGLWLVFFCALGAKDKMSTAGFSCMKIVVVFQMILSCIAVLAGLIVSVTFVVAAWASGTQAMIISAIITMVVMIIVAMLVIMYFFCYLATLKTCRLSAKNGETFGNASGYVAFVHIAGSLAFVINLLSGIVNAEISNIAGAAGQMGWMILFGLWIFGYRKKMKQFTEA